MKPWILPLVAIGAVAFLMTRPGRELQEQVSDNVGDWLDDGLSTLMRSSQRVQRTLHQAQTVLERVNRTLSQAAS